MSLLHAAAPDPAQLLPVRPSFAVASTDITEGAPLAARHAHGSVGGANVSPQLSWSGPPAATRGFAVTAFDPDVPTACGFWHWVLVDLPASARSLAAGAGSAARPAEGGFHTGNDFGDEAYDGPAPEAGDPPHRYVFMVHAMDVPTLGVRSTATPGFVNYHLAFHTLARAVIRGTYRVTGA